jgi:TolB protein
VVLPPPGDGARLAFTSNRDGDFEIYLIDLDGANLRKITDNETIQDFDPTWSPDGLQLAYASRTEDQEAEVWTINADGSDPRRLTENAATDFDPDWSPNGAWIAFASNRGGDFELWAMRSDGSDPCPLTSLGQTSLTPRWSPDGERLAFHARQGGDREGSELYLMEVNQDSANCEGLGRGAPIRLTANGWRDQWPDWSPDGLKLVYTSSEGRDTGQQTIFVLNLLDNSVQPITSGSDDDDDPAWSPDGTMVAFDSNRNGSGFFDIFILNIQTGQVSQLTFEAADDVVPRWQPGN